VDGETVFEWDPDADGASDVDNRTLYAGYHLDTETGLYSVRHRMYHPTLGRWVTRDPIGYADGMSLYEYCRSGPLGATDATGLRPMGPQDPGYQPGYETLPWKDVPETDKKCPCPCDGEEFIPPWEPELEPGAGVVPAGGALGLGDWRDYVYLGEWEGWEKEYGLDLKSLVERAAGVDPAADAYLRMSPQERAMWDAKYMSETTYEEEWFTTQYGLSFEGTAYIAHTFDIGLRVSLRTDGPGGVKIGWYVEPGLGAGSPSVSACLQGGNSVVTRKRSMLDVAPESEVSKYWQGNLGGNLGTGVVVGGTGTYTKSMDGKMSSKGYTVEVGFGALPGGSVRGVAGPGVEHTIYSSVD